MPEPTDQPADPIIAPIKVQRERIEQDGPESNPADHLAHAQRAYLYALHAAAGALFVVIPLSAIVIAASLIVTRSLTTTRPVLIGAFSFSVLTYFIWARALRMLIAADPAYRISGGLFIVRKSIMPAALVAGFAAGVLLALRLSPTANAIAPPLLMLALIAGGSTWITLVTAWRTRTLLARCAGRQDAVWSDIGALVCIVATLLALLVAGSTHLLSHALVAVIALLGSCGFALALVRLRSKIGAVMRDMERAEPGPAFEPVAPGS